MKCYICRQEEFHFHQDSNMLCQYREHGLNPLAGPPKPFVFSEEQGQVFQMYPFNFKMYELSSYIHNQNCGHTIYKMHFVTPLCFISDSSVLINYKFYCYNTHLVTVEGFMENQLLLVVPPAKKCYYLCCFNIFAKNFHKCHSKLHVTF